MKNTATHYRKDGESIRVIPRKFNDLIQLKKQGERGVFNEELLDILPEVKKFINRKLDAAVHKGHFPKSKYKAEDFIDQLFIEVYDNIEDVESENDFYLWLFKRTNELLDATIDKEAYEDKIFKNIDKYSEAEWKQMAEKWSAEADGDLIMREDLEDVSYHKSKQSLQQLFVEDNEKALIEKLDKELSEEDVNRFTELILNNFPEPMHTVFELFTRQKFTLEEISQIMERNLEEVETLLKEAREILYNSLSAWYPKK
ncbi:MAG: sigma-70 family RNA polymerase sigma factor [Flavobacterium sp.]|nr:MAG: sigma-70 family RNA polymerase sigma factor [Flavobacterium sp.]